MPKGLTMKQYKEWFDRGGEPVASGAGVRNEGDVIVTTVDDGEKITESRREKLPYKERIITVKDE